MRVISIFNHKGGCGKTTTAINLAASIAAGGRRTLLVDLDPQAHATIGCGVREDEVEMSTWDLLRGDGAAGAGLAFPDIAWEIFEKLYLAPASVGLASLEQTLAGAEDRDRRLRDRLAVAPDEYDQVVVDCGPGLGVLAVNALLAADEVLIPVDLGFFSLYGLTRALETIDMMATRYAHEPEARILATMYDTRARSMRRSLKTLRSQYEGAVLETVIRFTVALREAAAMGSPIVEHGPGSRGDQDYRALAQEILATDLHEAYEDLERAEAAADARQEQATDQRIELVYGAVLIDGGVRFVCHAPDARSVRIAGDFNEWTVEDGESEMTHREADGVWTREVPLGPGRYAYRFVIDGNWCSDPANPYVESNPYGELNSVVEIE